MDFTNLNKACPKDSFPLPRIDFIINSIVGYHMLSFMNAYLWYNQIRMNSINEDKTSFIIDQEL